MSLRLCLLISLGALFGCASTLQPSEFFAAPEPLLDQFQSQRGSLAAISAEARVDQFGEQGRIRGTVLMFVKDGGQVRFDVMTQFGPVLTLTSDGDQFALLDQREHRFLTGPTCAQNIARLLRLPLSARQASHVLLGGVPDVEIASQTMQWDGEEGHYRIVRHLADGSTQELHVTLDPRDEAAPLAEQRLRLVAVRMTDTAGKLAWEAFYREHGQARSESGQAFEVPFEVHVLQPSTETDTLIKFKDIRPNPDIPEGVFRQQAPGGVVIEEAPCE